MPLESLISPFIFESEAPMKRFVLLLSACAFVLAAQIAGCGGDSGGGLPTSSSATEDQSQWGEAKKYEAQLQKKLDAKEPRYLKKKR